MGNRAATGVCIGYSYLGYYGGKLEDSINVDTTNCKLHSSHVEQLALAWAHVLALALPAIPIHIHADSTTAILGHTDTLTQATLLTTLSLRQRAHTHLHHIHAHVGQPWNELCDTLAAWFANTPTTPPPLQHIAQTMVPQTDAPWAYVLNENHPNRQAYPPTTDNKICIEFNTLKAANHPASPNDDDLNTQLPSNFQPTQPTKATSKAPTVARLRVATYNGRRITDKPPPDNGSTNKTPSRLQLLRAQCHDEMIHITGM